ncbi:tyrosine-type recombinase/integrase [Pelagibacterium luteolum]|uniref:Integrase/recombinase XerD n=1 Tax=Pelagibacterium luteolum TaxID=440168 RepID=A0A1G7V1B9_9HYPH|nr:site-specific integrase [Pelagibacterium luteolum]SDG53514.1 integrase/recombinase XerD [Pelagibacterium luteolum]
MKQARVLTDAELKRVLALCDSHTQGKRNRLAVLLSHYAGLRVGEIASLKWSDVLNSDGTIRDQFYLKAENTKSKEARAVHLNDRLQRELRQWKSCLRQVTTDGPIIPSQKRSKHYNSELGHFSANSLCQLFARIYSAAGVDGASSHSGRRWFITRLAHSGVSPKVIMTLAGHKSLATTQRYIDINDEMMANAVGRL